MSYLIGEIFKLSPPWYIFRFLELVVNWKEMCLERRPTPAAIGEAVFGAGFASIDRS